MSALTEIEATAPPVPLVDLTDELRQREQAARQRKNEKRRRLQAKQSTPEQARVFVIPQPVVWLGLAAVIGLAIWIGFEVTGPEQSLPTDPGRVAQPDPTPNETTPVVTYVARCAQLGRCALGRCERQPADKARKRLLGHAG